MTYFLVEIGRQFCVFARHHRRLEPGIILGRKASLGGHLGRTSDRGGGIHPGEGDPAFADAGLSATSGHKCDNDCGYRVRTV